MADNEIGLIAFVDLDKLEAGAKRFDKLLDGMNAETGKVSTGISRGFDKMGDIVVGVAEKVAKAVIAATAAIAVGLATGLVASTKNAISFESAFAGVVKTVDGVADSAGNLTTEGEALRQEFRNLAKEIPVPVESLLKLGELGGQLGIPKEELIDFTRVVAMLGVTTNLTEEMAGTALAQIANIMGSTSEDITRAGSAIVALGNNSATTEQQIVSFAQRIAGAGALAGLSESDILAIGAAFSSIGVEAEAGGTAVQKVLIDMNTAVATGSEDLELFARTSGMTVSEFGRMWESDAAGAFTSFVEGLGAQGDNAILTLQELGLEDQRLVRSFLSMANAGNLLEESISLSSLAFEENTALAKEAEQRFATTESKIQLIKNQFRDLSFTIGGPLVDALSTIIDRFGPDAIAFFEDIAEKVAVFFTALVDGISSGDGALDSFLDALSSAGVDEQLVGDLSDFLETVIELGKWAAKHGPEIIDAITGIGVAFLTFKGITTAASGIQAVTTAMAGAGTVFTAASGGMSGIVALMGGPLIVAAGAAALAIGALAVAIKRYNDRIEEGRQKVNQQLTDLREASVATNNYTQEAEKLATALELSTTGLGKLTGTADDVRSAITSLIIETGDFTGSNEQLEASLQEVFGAGLRVEGNIITLNDRVIGATHAIRGMGEAVQIEKKAHDLAIESYKIGNEILRQQIEARMGVTRATEEETAAHQKAVENYQIGNEILRQQIMATYGAANALQGESAAREQTAEEIEREIARRKDVADIIRSSSQEQGTLIGSLITAHHDLFNAQVQLSQSPWDVDLIAKVQAAEMNVGAAFAAINESHRQMVFEIFVRNAEMSGSFDENAARIAVALGLVTEKEAAMRVEAEALAAGIGLVGDTLTQTFLEDGVVSTKEAAVLAQVIADMEAGVLTADQALRIFAAEGLGGLNAAGETAKGKTKDIGSEFEKLPSQAEDAATGISEKFEQQPWMDTGSQIPEDISQGITSKNKRPSDEAKIAAEATRKEFDQTQNWQAIGADIVAGIAAGIEAGKGSVSSAAAAAVADAVAAAKAAAGIQSPSKVAEDEIGDPFAEGIGKGISDGAPYVDKAVDDLVGKGREENVMEWGAKLGGILGDSLAEGIIANSENVQEAMSSLFELGGSFGSLGGSAAGILQRDTLDPLQEQMSNLDDLIKARGEGLVEQLGLRDITQLRAQIGSLMLDARLSGDTNTLALLNSFVRLDSERFQLSKEYAEQQEKILRLQEAQQNLSFLQQQTKLLDMISEHGLNAADILQGLELGIDADAGGVVEAMTRAIQAIINQAEGQLGIASPSAVFTSIGEFINEGLAKGLSMLRPVEAAMTRLDSALFKGMDSMMDLPAMTSAAFAQHGRSASIPTAPSSPSVVSLDPASLKALQGSVYNSRTYQLNTTSRESQTSLKDQFRLMEMIG